MIQYNSINNFKEIHYNGQDIKTVYDYQGEVWTKSFKFKASYSDGKSLNLACNGNTTLTKSETQPSGYVASAMTSAEIGNCVSQLSEPSTNNKGIFQNCTSLTSVTIADSVKLVYDNTFQNCTSLTSVTIPSGVTSIGEGAFTSCISLTSANIPSSVTSIGNYAFSNCTSLSSVTIPSGVTTLSKNVFASCSGMTSVTFEEGTQPLVISGGTFRKCTSLMELNIPDRVTTINATNVSGDEQAFYGCTSLTSLTIGSGITYIGKEAFMSCSGLTSITVNATTPPTLKRSTFGRWPFDFTNNCPIYVPCGSVDAYKAAAGWSTYASRIQCIDYFTIHALTNGTIDILENALHQSGYDILEYSKDNGTTYTSFSSPISVNGGDNVRFRVMTSKFWNGYQFSATCDFDVEGDLECLIIWGQTNIAGMFQDCTTLRSAERLVIPDNAFCGNMFRECTSLVTPPQLLATTLAYRCYDSMFFNCTSLTTAPNLPATTLTDSCYNLMFYGCTSLTSAPQLPATTFTDSCYAGMFFNCTSLTTAPNLPATTLTDSCYASMFFNCTSLTTAPNLPATTLAYRCYDSMFFNCTSLTTAPNLPATTLADRCYLQMFRGCTSLNYIKCLSTDMSAEDCLAAWVDGVASSGTFVKDSSADWGTCGQNAIPCEWNVEEE